MKMEQNPQNCYENPYQQARKAAAKYSDSLNSQAGAAEMLGLSVSTVSDYELGLTIPPADKVCKMAHLYNAPELKRHYCKNECPIGRDMPISGHVKTIEQVALRLNTLLSPRGINLESIKLDVMEIAQDGKITADERPKLQEAMDKLTDMQKVIEELRVTCEKAFRGEMT